MPTLPELRHALMLLQVEGCTADLSLDKVYCQKKAVCSEHLKVCHAVCWQHHAMTGLVLLR
jgi:hypothetical protein